MEIQTFKDLKNLVKTDPEKIIKLMRYSSNPRNIYMFNLDNKLNNSLLHLFSLFNPYYLYFIFISNTFQPDFESNNLFFRKNIFGLTWLHSLCIYNVIYFENIKDFVTETLALEQDSVGNTFLHIIALYNPNHLEKVLDHVYKTMNYNKVLMKKDIMGNTFLHVLFQNHPNIYKKYINKFSNELLQVKNIFNKKCYDLIIY